MQLSPLHVPDPELIDNHLELIANILQSTAHPYQKFQKHLKSGWTPDLSANQRGHTEPRSELGVPDVVTILKESSTIMQR